MNRENDGKEIADACQSQFARSPVVAIGLGDQQPSIPPLRTAVNDTRRLADMSRAL